MKVELTCGSESVSFGELPHAREELSETTAEDGHADDDIGVCNAPCLDVVQRKHQGGRGEREEAARQGPSVSQKRTKTRLKSEGTYRGAGFAMRVRGAALALST